MLCVLNTVRELHLSRRVLRPLREREWTIVAQAPWSHVETSHVETESPCPIVALSHGGMDTMMGRASVALSQFATSHSGPQL